MSLTGEKEVSNVSLTSFALKANEGYSKIALWIPVASSMLYPWVLEAFHIAMTSGGGAGTPSGVIEGGIWLTIAFLLPLSCFAFAFGRGPFARLAPVDAMSRRVALAGVTVPPLYVLTGVVSGVLHSPIPERAIWVAAWFAVGLAASLAKPAAAAPGGEEWTDRLRIVHGISAALILLYVAFHLSNHLLGLIGPDLHARVMRIGREVYRSGVVEPVVVGLLLFQAATGLWLSWRWSASGLSLIRTIQVGSGVYLAAFVIAHLNSAFVARTVRHIQTDWAWAAGAPTGLIMDAWNIRLVPDYALAVFFVVTHVFCGLRGILLAHRVQTTTADRIWLGGIVTAVALSTAIMCGLCGLRILIRFSPHSARARRRGRRKVFGRGGSGVGVAPSHWPRRNDPTSCCSNVFTHALTADAFRPT